MGGGKGTIIIIIMNLSWKGEKQGIRSLYGVKQDKNQWIMNPNGVENDLELAFLLSGVQER